MSVSTVVSEKSHENNKKCKEEKEEEQYFLASLRNVRDMVVCNFFDIYMFNLSSTAHWCQYLTHSAFPSVFWGC